MDAEAEDFPTDVVSTSCTHGASPDGVDLVGYADGTAARDDQVAVEDHLERCPECSAAVDDLRVTLLLLDIAHDID